MEDKTNQPNPQPVTNLKIWIAVTVAVIITAVLVGCGVYAWQQAIATSVERELANVKSQLALLQSSPQQSVVPSASPVSTVHNPPSSWKTYTSTQYALTFKYPPDWEAVLNQHNKVRQLVGDYTDAIYKKSTTQKYPDPSFPLDALIITDELSNPNNLSLQELFNQQQAECDRRPAEEVGNLPCPGSQNTATWQQITVGGKTALRSGKRNIPEGLPQDDVYIPLNGKFLIFSARYYNLTYKQLSDIFDQVLASVTFE